MNLQNCPRCDPFQNRTNFGGRIDTVYTGIFGGKEKNDQEKIKIDFELINLGFKPIKLVFGFRKNGLGQLQTDRLGSDIPALRI